jgi:hypothetical protein
MQGAGTGVEGSSGTGCRDPVAGLQLRGGAVCRVAM